MTVSIGTAAITRETTCEARPANRADLITRR